MIYAIECRSYDVVVCLVEAGCDVNKRFVRVETTPLMVLIANRYRALMWVVDLLLICCWIVWLIHA